MRIAIIGPAHPLRGGLASFNQRLAQQFLAEGHDCELISFSLQYPGFLFPGTTQYTEEPPPKGLTIHTRINSVNPLNWWTTRRWLRAKDFDIIVVRFWLPFMGPALGTILRGVKKGKSPVVICIADNVIPHEKRPGDTAFTTYFLKSCDTFITMSEKVLADLRKFESRKQAVVVQHPLYDAFGDRMDMAAARAHLGLPEGEKIVLFFGFIRKYKGLDLLLEAMADKRILAAGIRLLVAGEFYEDKEAYDQKIQELRIEDRLILRTDFIADSEVKYYLCAGDAIIQPYKNATQSGVTPLAYHFEKPMVVTNVGGLAALVPHERAGLVCEPNATSIADAILRFYELGEAYFIPHLRTEKLKYSWNNLTGAILDLAKA